MADTSLDSTASQPGPDVSDATLRILYRISEILASGTYQKQTLAEVLDILDAEHGLRRSTIVLLSPDGNELTIEVAHSFSQSELQAIRYQVGEGIIGRVVQNGKLAIVPKISQEPLFLDRLHQRRKVSKDEISFICVPITIGSDVVGALSVDRVFDESISLTEDARLLTIVASMIANDVKARRDLSAQRAALVQQPQEV